MADFPAAVPFAKVTAWLTQAVADTGDIGTEPDMTAMVGTVTFIPNVVRVKVPDALPQPMTVFPRAIVCALDSEGFLLGPDNERDVTLIATGDLIPSYRVTFDLDGVDRFTLTLALPEGAVVDLATALVVPDNIPAELDAWLEAALRAEAAALAARTYEPVVTANRPTTPGPGRTAFDTDLGIPIWYSGTSWVDSAGNPV